MAAHFRRGEKPSPGGRWHAKGVTDEGRDAVTAWRWLPCAGHNPTRREPYTSPGEIQNRRAADLFSRPAVLFCNASTII